MSSSNLESECAFILATANLCRLSLTLYHDILWLILLFVFVSRVILHGVLTWYSYLCWLILTPCHLLFLFRIHNINSAILLSTLWTIIISHKSDSHGWTPLGSILWCMQNCDMLIIHLLSQHSCCGHATKGSSRGERFTPIHWTNLLWIFVWDKIADMIKCKYWVSSPILSCATILSPQNCTSWSSPPVKEVTMPNYWLYLEQNKSTDHQCSSRPCHEVWHPTTTASTFSLY